jgi:hypothetical protein
LVDASGIGKNQIEMGLSQDKRVLIYKREFSFGNKDQLVFSAATYPALKRLFEAYNKANTHSLTLRQSDTQAGGK